MASEDGYTPAKPLVVELEYQDGAQHNYTPLVIQDQERHTPVFTLPRELERNVAVLNEFVFPDWLLERLVRHTNAYAKSRLNADDVKDVTKAEILYFLAIYYYMGVVQLPARRDYWKIPTQFWPPHPICQNLSRNRFDYIWRNLHLNAPDPQEEEEEEVDMEGEVEESEDDEPELVADVKWFSKCELIIDHVNTVSKKICSYPGFCVSIDEQMKKFKGRSSQTVRMKNKPIKEGYKFFALCDATTGYVWHFIPNGRLEKTTILDLVTALADTLPDPNRHKYVIGMDNYFTLPKVLAALRSKNIAAVGTARARSGWPPKEIKNVNDDRFNTFHLLPDKENFLIGRWVDNAIVTMVTTIHTGKESVATERRRPRKTNTNKNHIVTVWGASAVRLIEIPKVIDDYNHWMLGVDKSDQYIAYYRPAVKCCRVWMPILFHCLDILRVNAYVAACRLCEEQMDHKDFVVTWVQTLVGRAVSVLYQNTRAVAHAMEMKPPSTKKRSRYIGTSLKLSEMRFSGQPEHHQVGLRKDGRQQRCEYCRFLAEKDRRDQVTPLHTIKRVTRYCVKCNIPLCSEHFIIYHTRDNAEV